jgi:hypothetical protein
MADQKPAIFFTVGIYDTLNVRNAYLVRHMLKLCVPHGTTAVLLFDDYSTFQLIEAFPVHPYEQRKDNLEYFVKNVFRITKVDPSDTVKAFIDEMKSKGLRPIYVEYDTNQDFVWRPILKENGVPIRFIKNPHVTPPTGN